MFSVEQKSTSTFKGSFFVQTQASLVFVHKFLLRLRVELPTFITNIFQHVLSGLDKTVI